MIIRLITGLGLALVVATALAQPLNRLSHIHGIAVAPQGEGLYLATHNGFYRLGNDGDAQLVSPTTDDFMALVPDPARPGGFYASGHPRGGGNLGLLRSQDGGRSWQQVSAGLNGPVDFHALTVSPVDPLRIYGMFGGLQVSGDGGKSWMMANLPRGVSALAASSSDADTLYAATDKGLKRSQDAGKRWLPAMMMQLPASVVHVTSDGHAYTYLVGKGLMKLKEPGVGWKPIYDGFGGAVPVQMASDRDAPERLFVLDSQGRLWRSEDGGINWKSYPEVQG